jgi:hypothetical protein
VELVDLVAVARKNIRELLEQVTAYSGAADDDLVSWRIAALEEKFEQLSNQLAQQRP